MGKNIKISILATCLLFAAVVSASQTTNLLPINDGTYKNWTPSTGAVHYTLVDENACNGTTDYLYTSTISSRDSFGVNISTVPNGAQITQINVTPCASRNAGGGVNPIMNVFYRMDGVDSADAGAYTLTGTTPTQLLATTFNGLSVIKTPNTSLESGAVLTSGSKGARLSRLATVITYTALTAPASTTATTVSSTQIDLAWIDTTTFEDGFVIERRGNTASSSYQVIATTSANTTSYSDTNLSASNTYTYKLRAYNIGGFSAYSNAASSTTNF